MSKTLSPAAVRVHEALANKDVTCPDCGRTLRPAGTYEASDGPAGLRIVTTWTCHRCGWQDGIWREAQAGEPL